MSVQPKTRRAVYTNRRTGEVTYFKPAVLKTALEISRERNDEKFTALLAARAERLQVRRVVRGCGVCVATGGT